MPIWQGSCKTSSPSRNPPNVVAPEAPLPKSRFQRLTAAAVAVTFFCTNIFLTAPSARAEVSLPPFLTSPDFQIPAELGVVEEIYTPLLSSPLEGRSKVGGPFIIHIQTAHGSYETQKKIEALLRHLQKNYGVEVFLLEGTEGALEPGLDRYFEKTEWNREVLEYRAGEGQTSGVSLFLLDAPASVRALGIEAAEAYRKNRLAFQEVFRMAEGGQKSLNLLNQEMEALRGEFLSKPLRDFLARRAAFEEKRFELFHWFRFLGKMSRKVLGVSLSDPTLQKDWPNTVRLAKLLKIESALDWKGIERERQSFLAEMQRLLSPSLLQELKNLLTPSPSPLPLGERDWVRGLSQYPYAGVRYLLERVVDSLPSSYHFDRFPSLRIFIQLLVFRNEIQGPSLFEELDRLTRDIENRMAGDERSRKIVQILDDYRLLKRLLALELTPRDYEKVGENLRPSRFIKRILDVRPSPQPSPPSRGRGKGEGAFSRLDPLFAQALEFYEGAKEREKWMAENISKLAEGSEKPVVVVTGGFHAPGLKEFFKSHGLGFALVMPKIDEIDSRQGYIDSILGKRPGLFAEAAALEDARSLPVPPAVLKRLGIDPEIEKEFRLETILRSGLPWQKSGKTIVTQLTQSRFGQAYGLQFNFDGARPQILDSNSQRGWSYDPVLQRLRPAETPRAEVRPSGARAEVRAKKAQNAPLSVKFFPQIDKLRSDVQGEATAGDTYLEAYPDLLSEKTLLEHEKGELFLKFSERQNAEAVELYLTGENSLALRTILQRILNREIALEEIESPILVLPRAFGDFERIFRAFVEIKGREEPVTFALHAPRDQFADFVMFQDAQNQSSLGGHVSPHYLARPYVIGKSRAKDGTVMRIFANEWLDGYYEAHIDSRINGSRFILWKYSDTSPDNPRIQDDEAMRQIATQIYKILTVYHEINLNHVTLNGGDFVVRQNPNGSFDVKLITARFVDPEQIKIGYNASKNQVFLRASLFNFLGHLLELRAADYQDLLGKGQPRVFRRESDLPFALLRIADFDTVLEGFYEGFKERLFLAGFPQAGADDLNTAFTQALDGFVERIDTLGNDYVKKHRGEIIQAIERFKNRLVLPRAEVRQPRLSAEEAGKLKEELNLKGLFQRYQNLVDVLGVDIDGEPQLIIAASGHVKLVRTSSRYEGVLIPFTESNLPSKGLLVSLLRSLNIEEIKIIFSITSLDVASQEGIKAYFGRFGTVQTIIPPLGLIEGLLEDFLSDLRQRGKDPRHDRAYYQTHYLYDGNSFTTPIHPVSGRSHNLESFAFDASSSGGGIYRLRFGPWRGAVFQPPDQFDQLLTTLDQLSRNQEFLGLNVDRAARTLETNVNVTEDRLQEVGPGERDYKARLTKREGGAFLLRISEAQTVQVIFNPPSMQIVMPDGRKVNGLTGSPTPLRAIGVNPMKSSSEYGTDLYLVLDAVTHQNLTRLLQEHGVKLGRAFLLSPARAEVRAEPKGISGASVSSALQTSRLQRVQLQLSKQWQGLQSQLLPFTKLLSSGKRTTSPIQIVSQRQAPEQASPIRERLKKTPRQGVLQRGFWKNPSASAPPLPFETIRTFQAALYGIVRLAEGLLFVNYYFNKDKSPRAEVRVSKKDVAFARMIAKLDPSDIYDEQTLTSIRSIKWELRMSSAKLLEKSYRRLIEQRARELKGLPPVRLQSIHESNLEFFAAFRRSGRLSAEEVITLLEKVPLTFFKEALQALLAFKKDDPKRLVNPEFVRWLRRYHQMLEKDMKKGWKKAKKADIDAMPLEKAEELAGRIIADVDAQNEKKIILALEMIAHESEGLTRAIEITPKKILEKLDERNLDIWDENIIRAIAKFNSDLRQTVYFIAISGRPQMYHIVPRAEVRLQQIKKRSGNLTRGFEGGEPFLKLPQVVLGGNRGKNFMDEGHLDFKLADIFFKLANIFTDILKALAERTKLALEIFQNYLKFSLTGIFRSRNFFRGFAHGGPIVTLHPTDVNRTEPAPPEGLRSAPASTKPDEGGRSRAEVRATQEELQASLEKLQALLPNGELRQFSYLLSILGHHGYAEVLPTVLASLNENPKAPQIKGTVDGNSAWNLLQFVRDNTEDVSPRKKIASLQRSALLEPLYTVARIINFIWFKDGRQRPEAERKEIIKHVLGATFYPIGGGSSPMSFRIEIDDKVSEKRTMTVEEFLKQRNQSTRGLEIRLTLVSGGVAAGAIESVGKRPIGEVKVIEGALAVARFGNRPFPSTDEPPKKRAELRFAEKTVIRFAVEVADRIILPGDFHLLEAVIGTKEAVAAPAPTPADFRAISRKTDTVFTGPALNHARSNFGLIQGPHSTFKGTVGFLVGPKIFEEFGAALVPLQKQLGQEVRFAIVAAGNPEEISVLMQTVNTLNKDLPADLQILVYDNPFAARHSLARKVSRVQGFGLEPDTALLRQVLPDFTPWSQAQLDSFVSGIPGLSELLAQFSAQLHRALETAA